ncbi:hypothetical protein [Nocardia sp. NPDC050406]|uniref:hypothetical protein n=1 Tax=Nocardia sp. NPDC050406 TaxID=3364318 RepID=UPI0037B7006A
MTSFVTKTIAATALSLGVVAAPAYATPVELQPMTDPHPVSSTGSALTDYTGSAVGTDFSGSAESMIDALPTLPCLLLSLSGIQTCDLTGPRVPQ